MHELAIAEGIVAAVCDRMGAAGRVRRVFLEIGSLSCVEPHAVEFAFEVCARGTRAEGACLECRRIPGRGRCHHCRAELEVEGPIAQCACGSIDIEILSGEGLKVTGMEVQ